jgi:hypothetical protein
MGDILNGWDSPGFLQTDPGPLWTMGRDFGIIYWLLQHTSQREERAERDDEADMEALCDSQSPGFPVHPWPSPPAHRSLAPFGAYPSWFFRGRSAVMGQRGTSDGPVWFQIISCRVRKAVLHTMNNFFKVTVFIPPWNKFSRWPYSHPDRFNVFWKSQDNLNKCHCKLRAYQD